MIDCQIIERRFLYKKRWVVMNYVLLKTVIYLSFQQLHPDVDCHVFNSKATVVLEL